MKDKCRAGVLALMGLVIGTVLTGCGDRQETTSKTTSLAPQTTAVETVPVVFDSTTQAPFGVTQLSLYIYNQAAGIRERADHFTSTWEQGKDIVSFEAFATEADSFSLAGTNFKEKWERFWNTYENHQACKIGYTVSFQLKSGEEVRQTILGPDDVFGYRNYLECYLYDDVHQVQGNWYSHLLASEVTDETVMTSIKLTAGTDIAQVGDMITLTAFVYSSDADFDEAGNYTGTARYTVTVKNV